MSGSAVTLTLAEAVQRIDTVTVAYAAPDTNPLRDADNLKLAVTGFGDTKTATNDTPADTVAPTLVSAVVNGSTATLTYDEALDESSVPVAGTQVLFAGLEGGVNSNRAAAIAIEGATVTLTLHGRARHGSAVAMTYLQGNDAATRLKDLAGNEAAGFDLQLMTNATPPAFVSASVDGAALTVTFDGALDEGSVPAASAFTVKATRSGTERTVALADADPVSVSGSAVTLTLAEAVQRIDTVTVAYAAPDTNPLRDADNLKLAVTGFGDTKTATNDTPADTVAPAFVSASINGTVLTVVFDEALDESVPQHGPLAPFGIRTTTGAGGQSYSISGNTVTVIFSAPGGRPTARR